MLKKMSSIIALGLIVGFLSIPAASFARNNGNGPGDGTGDNLQCLGGIIVDGVCICDDLLGSITPKGNFDVTKGPNGTNCDGIPDLECVDGEDSLNPACLDAISTEGNFDVAARRDNAEPDCDDPDGTPWWMNV